MAALVSATIVVESVVLTDREPPPEADTVFTCGDVAFDATFTATMIGGKSEPEINGPFRVQEVPEQFQPSPERETNVRPDGRDSVTVTTSDVSGTPPMLPTVTV
jgi:hypothetical protein